MGVRGKERVAFAAWAALVTLAVASRFYLPGLAASQGDWPAPLDDVYIHYDFARAWGTGHPFAWIAGQGYSSGESSPAYGMLLGLGYALGFHGLHLGVWAALVACASLVVLLVTLVRAAWPGRVAPLALLAPPLFVAFGTLDFAWWSGMEVALFGAVAAALLLASHRARHAGPHAKAARQWKAGLVGALLVLVRPESAVVVAVAAVVVARRAWRGSAILAMVRVGLPGALATLGVAAMNRAFTGDAASAGALLKLLSSNPFSTDVDRARDYVLGLGSFAYTVAKDLGLSRLALGLPLLALLSLASRRTRGLGLLALGGSTLYTLLVSWNGAARFQNYRDYMPAFTLLLFAATLGLAALSRHRVGRLVGAGLGLLVVGLGAPHVTDGARLYARAARNIHDQQVTVGRLLAREQPRDAIVLVGDAGAIPYVSGLHAVDALGLGGYHGVPFVRAAPHGEAATLELLERLRPDERPTVLALYPNWFPGITGRFGHETARITIDDNVICGGPTKGIYRADWGSLGSAPGLGAVEEDLGGAVRDELDVADVVDETEHAYLSPAPLGGWTLFDVRATGDGHARFDAGRITPERAAESFVARGGCGHDGALVVRTDDEPSDVEVSVGGVAVGQLGPPDVPAGSAGGRWRLRRLPIARGVRTGDRVTLRVTRGSLHDFHAWLVGGKA